jgi:hypothetical protein
MKKLVLLLLALPLFCLSQEKNVLNVSRFFPKGDKTGSFLKALEAHSQKYHKGTWKWRVNSIESGPDAGGYSITEGPMSWDDMDTRGELGKEHQADFDENIQPLLTEKYQSSFIIYRPDLSTIQLTDYSDKMAINHVFVKPGYVDDMEDLIKKLKKGWENGGSTVAVFEASSSGPPQFIIVTRYKQGLKERNVGFRKPLKERYNQANGEGSWLEFNKALRTMVDHSWSELLFFHPELSSK